MSEVDYVAGVVPTEGNLDATEAKTVAAQNTAPTNHPEGRLWYDTNAAHPILYAYNGTDWWAFPAGPVVKGAIVNTGTVPPYNITSEVAINGSELYFTAETDHRYAFEVDFIIRGNETGDLFTITPQIWDGSSWADVDLDYVIQIQVADQQQREHLRLIDGSGSGDCGFRLLIDRTYGTGGAQIEGGTDCTVSHLGLATLV